uniref:Cyclin-dependent kinase inhibitor domain-containing protein n=1 Tax=Cacopsylla melanoneura TaxID=428564 RepID=A0A8D9EBT9_9HEMI
MSPNLATSLGDARRSDVRRIKRNLFGPIDQEKTKAWLENELGNLLTNACDKWDFDFKNEKPMNCERSQYVWERIEPLSPKSVAMRGLRFDAMDLVEDEQNNNVDNSVQYVKTGDILGFKQRQTRITDFLTKKKRPMSLTHNVPSVKRFKESVASIPSCSSSSSASSSSSTSTSSSSEDLSLRNSQSAAPTVASGLCQF